MSSGKRLRKRPPNVKTVLTVASQIGMDVEISRDGSMKVVGRPQGGAPTSEPETPEDVKQLL
jgi:hypothetical protein